MYGNENDPKSGNVYANAQHQQAAVVPAGAIYSEIHTQTSLEFPKAQAYKYKTWRLGDAAAEIKLQRSAAGFKPYTLNP